MEGSVWWSVAYWHSDNSSPRALGSCVGPWALLAQAEERLDISYGIYTLFGSSLYMVFGARFVSTRCCVFILTLRRLRQSVPWHLAMPTDYG